MALMLKLWHEEFIFTYMGEYCKIKQQWIDHAYIAFGEWGPTFSLKKLAERTGLPRASFYYYFDNKEHLINELLLLHRLKASYYLIELDARVMKLIPDLYELLYLNKAELLFHYQLFKHLHKNTYYDLYKDLNTQSFKVLLPHIKSLFKTDASEEELIGFYQTLTDAWYARLDIKDLSVKSMMDLGIEIMKNTLGMFNHH